MGLCRLVGRSRTAVASALAAGRVCDVPEADGATLVPSASSSSLPGAPPKIAASTLILKGGGVKGLRSPGALSELAPYTALRRSRNLRGFLTAVLLGAGYDAEELLRVLRGLDFRSLLDSRWRWPWNLVTRQGLNSGDGLETWLSERIRDKIKQEQPVRTAGFLRKRAVLFASTWGHATVPFDGDGDKNVNTPAAFAARCSSSIPIFFVSREHNGSFLYDGGLLNNFPVEASMKLLGDDFLGLYATAADRSSPPRSQLSRILDIIIERDATGALVDRYADRMIVIDP